MNAASWTVCLLKTRSDFADDEFKRKRSRTLYLHQRASAELPAAHGELTALGVH